LPSNLDKLFYVILMSFLKIFWIIVVYILSLRLFVHKLFDKVRNCKWSKAVRIDTGEYSETNTLNIAFNRTGEALAISNYDQGVYVRRFIPNKGWLEATCIDKTINSDNPEATTRSRRYDPQICLDGQGNSLASWHEDQEFEIVSGHTGTSWINQYRVGSGWGEPRPFDLDLNGCGAVKIAGDQQGNVIAVWCRNSREQSTVACKHYSPETGWGKTFKISEHSLYIHNLNIFGDQQGHYVVTWDGREDHSADDEFFYKGHVPVYARYYSINNGWSDEELIRSDFYYDKIDFEVAFDQSGNVILVWEHYIVASPDRSIICAIRYSVDNGWGRACEIDPGITDRSENISESNNPKIAFDHAGNAIAVWYQNSDRRYGAIWTNRYNSKSNSWERAHHISTENANQTEPQLAVATSGTACVTWAQQGGIACSLYTNDTRWSSPELIHKDNRTYGDYAPRIAIDSKDMFIVIWMQESSKFSTFWSRIYTEKTGWETSERLLRDYACHSLSPEVELDPAGVAHVIWDTSDRESCNTHFWSSYLQLQDNTDA